MLFMHVFKAKFGTTMPFPYYIYMYTSCTFWYGRKGDTVQIRKGLCEIFSCRAIKIPTQFYTVNNQRGIVYVEYFAKAFTELTNVNMLLIL